jgi:N-acetylmuramoyl-L-alanine amidase
MLRPSASYALRDSRKPDEGLLSLSFWPRLAGTGLRKSRFSQMIIVLCALVLLSVQANANNAKPQTRATKGTEAVSTAVPELKSVPVVAISAQLRQDDRAATLSILMSRPVSAQAFSLEGPDRIVIDLPDVNFQIEEAPSRRVETTGASAGLIASYRYGAIVTGRSRIVIELKQPAMVKRIESVIRPTGEAATLTIELVRATRPEFVAAVTRARPAPVAAVPVDAAATSDHRPTIVIDPGHGGIDPGAIGARGAMEKTLVFAFAQSLQQKLEASGRFRVVMTRNSDVFVGLGERVRIAREARGDLFVSIHADTLSAAPGVRGATIYTGAERASDSEAALLAEKENRADAAAGVDDAELVEEVAGILADLTLRETRAFSLQAAQQVVADLGPVIRLNKNPLRSAGFRVLKAPDVPSILVELGYLSSNDDVALMQSPDWRDRSTGAISAAILRYFGNRAGGNGRASVSP